MGRSHLKFDHGDITTVLNSKLTSHQITHIEKKPCKCEECDKRFAQNVDLVWHHRTHNGEKFQCYSD